MPRSIHGILRITILILLLLKCLGLYWFSYSNHFNIIITWMLRSIMVFLLHPPKEHSIFFLPVCATCFNYLVFLEFITRKVFDEFKSWSFSLRSFSYLPIFVQSANTCCMLSFGYSLSSEFYMSTFQNTLFHPQLSAYEDGTDTAFRNVGI